MIRADCEEARIFALGACVGLQGNGREARDFGEPSLKLGQLTGIISAAALSFIVQDPSGIMEVVSDRSRDSRRLM